MTATCGKSCPVTGPFSDGGCTEPVGHPGAHRAGGASWWSEGDKTIVEVRGSRSASPQFMWNLGRKVPIGIRLKVRDAVGRELVYAHRWDAVEEETEPGQRGVWVTTGLTGPDADGIRAEVEVHVGLYQP